MHLGCLRLSDVPWLPQPAAQADGLPQQRNTLFCRPGASVVDALGLATPGDCGVCCSSAGGGTHCRVDIGEDGTVVASLAAATAEGKWLLAAWAPSGARLRAEATAAPQ